MNVGKELYENPKGGVEEHRGTHKKVTSLPSSSILESQKIISKIAKPRKSSVNSILEIQR